MPGQTETSILNTGARYNDLPSARYTAVPERRSSGENVVHDPAAHVGQAEVAATVEERQLSVIEAELVEHRGVQVVDVDGVLHGFPAYIVGGAVGQTFLEAASRRHRGEAHMLVAPAAVLAAAVPLPR